MRVATSRRAWLGPASFAVSLVLFAIGLALVRTLEPHTPLFDTIGWGSSWLGFGAVGAILVLRRPDHRVGWILCGITFSMGVMLISVDYPSYVALTGNGSAAVARAALVLSDLFAVLGFVLVPLLLAVFPDGATPVGWARWVVRAFVVVAVLDTAVWVVQPVIVETTAPGGATIVKPFAILSAPVAASLALTLGSVLAALALLIVVDLMLRARRAEGIRRLQFRWLSRAALVLPLLFLAGIVADSLFPDEPGEYGPGDWLITSAFLLGLSAIAGAIGVAVLRHRLYEIDRIVSRTLSYSLVTALLGGVYAAGVVGVGAVTPTGRSDLVVAATTLVVAAIARPLLSRVRHVVDLRFNRPRIATEHAAEQFRARLREQIDLGDCIAVLTETVGSSLRPAVLSVWLPPTMVASDR